MAVCFPSETCRSFETDFVEIKTSNRQRKPTLNVLWEWLVFFMVLCLKDINFRNLHIWICKKVLKHFGVLIPLEWISIRMTNSFWGSLEWIENIVWWEAQHDPAMGACRPENQLYPGLHEKKSVQQGQGGDSAHRLCSGETPPARLHPVLGLLT